MRLELSAKLTQKLSPQILQSMKLLQMTMPELLAYVQEQLQETPFWKAAREAMMFRRCSGAWNSWNLWTPALPRRRPRATTTAPTRSTDTARCGTTRSRSIRTCARSWRRRTRKNACAPLPAILPRVWTRTGIWTRIVRTFPRGSACRFRRSRRGLPCCSPWTRPASARAACASACFCSLRRAEG